MELKEGMYIRFSDKKKNTYIRKVIDGYKKGWYGCRVDKDANNVPYVSQKNILKTSYNIIDLIEVGDYVNGSKVIKIDIYNDEKYVYVDETEYINALQDYENIYYKEETIESIVTREQFESIRYMIGE